MNVLVVGRGWVGTKIFNELVLRGHVVSLCSHKDAINNIKKIEHDWVVNCAGVTGQPNVDACENDKKMLTNKKQ